MRLLFFIYFLLVAISLAGGFGWQALWVLGLGVALAVVRPREFIFLVVPFSFFIPPTPPSIGLLELLFAVALVISVARIIFDTKDEFVLLLRSWPLVFAALAVTVLLLINWYMAKGSGVPLGSWIRGVLPFGFLLYSIPIFLLVRKSPANADMWWISLLLAAAFLSSQVIRVYLVDELWQPSEYYLVDGAWKRALEQGGASGHIPKMLMLRVTQRLQQATDVLLPIGAVLGSWHAVYGKTLWLRYLGVGTASLAVVAVTLTLTRSMHVAVLCGVLIVVMSAIAARHFLRTLVLSGVLLASFLLPILSFNLAPIYLNRTLQTVQYFDPYGGDAEGEVAPHRDENITARFEEYKIAHELFSESPIFGKGLGVVHKMRFANGVGGIVEADVGYVHNWVMYFLMVGGVVGLLLYSMILFGPLFIGRLTQTSNSLLWSLVATVSVYALFFAVFRLIPYNLILGGLWGVLLGASGRFRRIGGI